MVQILENNEGGILNSLLGGAQRGSKATEGLVQSLQKQQQEQKKQQFLDQLLGMGSQQSQQQSNQSVGNAKTVSQLEGKGNTQSFNPSSISDEAIVAATLIDPALGRNLQHMKDVNLREKRAEKEMSPEYQREKTITGAQADADIKFNEELQSAKKSTYLKSKTLENLEALNKKGVTGKAYEKSLEKIGLISQTSEGRREFAAEVKNLITDIKSILGGQFSNSEFQIILNAYPSADFSKEANSAIIKNLKDFQDIRNQEIIIGQNLKKENSGKIPEDFQGKVNERLDQYITSKIPEIKANTAKIMREKYNVLPGQTLLFAPNGRPIAVNDDQVEQMLEMGANFQ